MDALVGSVLIGAAIAAIAAGLTYRLVSPAGSDAWLADLFRRTSDRYLGSGIGHWEVARARLRNDPIYQAILMPGLLPVGGTVIDLGCGRGLRLAFLAEARHAYIDHRWPRSLPAPPQFARMVGVETQRRLATGAREALEADAEVFEADIRDGLRSPLQAALLFDSLRSLPPAEQDSLLGLVAAALDERGAVLVGEIDRGLGWRFALISTRHRLKALLLPRSRHTFYPRTREQWRECFERQGFHVETPGLPGRSGKPASARLFFRLTRVAGASGSDRQL
jgi:SAM-dependent methyltransferase